MKTLLVVLLFCYSHLVRAQEHGLKKRVIYMELFGSSLYSMSVNFENVVGKLGNVHYGYRVGAGAYVPEGGSLALPVGVFAFTGTRSSHFEFSTGMSLLHEVINQYGFDNLPLFESTTLVVPVGMGYRFQKPDGGFFFRLTANAGFLVHEFTGNEHADKTYPTFGVSVGSTL
jgi:hypothetical protein